MKKTWKAPEMEAVKIMNTEYNPSGGTKVDGFYTSNRTDLDGNIIPGTTNIIGPTFS